MKLQTKVERDMRPDLVEREDFSSKVDERKVSNISGLKTANRSQRVKTTSSPRIGGKGNKRKRKKRAKAAEIKEIHVEDAKVKSDKPENALRTAVDTGINTAVENTGGSSGRARLPPRRGNIKEDKPKAKREKYNSAKMDSDGSAAIEMVQTVQSVANTAVQAGGMIRTAVKGTSNGIGKIKTAVCGGVRVGSAKDVLKGTGRVATAVNSAVANAAKDTGHQLLKTKIDKSTTTDTGTETIKQGLTELRYADNARKAVVNTKKAASKLKYKPKTQSKYKNHRLIRKNSKGARKQAAANFRKVVTSKAGLIVLGVAAAHIVIILLVNALVTLICSVISSLFSWLCPPSDTDNSKTEAEMISDYRTSVVEYIDTKQDEIDEIVDGFVCDHKSYSPYSEISELNQYGNKEIEADCYDEILAILAVKKYREMGDNADNMQNMELNFTDEEIAETVERFYNFEYSYSYGHCSGNDCKKRVRRVVHNRGTEDEWTETITTYYCDVNHQWLYGEVTNRTLDEVLASYNFTDEEKDLYQIYLEQIGLMGG